MKKLRFILVFALSLTALTETNAQTIFQENFNGGNSFNNWTLINVDGRTPAAPVAYVTNAWVVREDFDTTGVGDSVAVSTSWYSPPGASDDYMITPMIITQASSILEFDAKAQDPAFPDGYELRISTTTPTVAGLLANPALFSVASENASWTRRTFSLASYPNDTIYIGWRNNSNDDFLLLIDNIKVSQPSAEDAAMESLNLPSVIAGSSPITIGGTIRNAGSSTITSLEVNWREVGSATINRDTLSLSLPSTAQTSFAHGISWSPTTFGQNYDIEVWTSNPNGQVDGNTANDTIRTTVFVNLGNTVTRNVLFEEFTTAVCQFCPDGHVIQEQIVNSIPTVIPVGVHACFNTDAMTVPEASTLCTVLGPNSAPSGMVDRVLYDGETRVGHGRGGGVWPLRCSTRTALGSPLDITLSGTYNPATRLLNLDVNSSFVDYVLPGDIRVSLMLLQDSMSGTGNGWAQYNAYYSVNGHPFFGIGTPFPPPNQTISFINNYQHRHVLRDIFPNTWGDATVIPNNYQLNTTYTRNFTQGISTAHDEIQVYLVAVVHYFGSTQEDFEVINAKEIKLTDLIVTGIEENTLDNSFEIYPNPTDLPYTNVKFKLDENAAVQARILDLTGKVVSEQDFGVMSQGNQLIQLNTDQLENGFYFVNFIAGDQEISRKISVLK